MTGKIDHFSETRLWWFCIFANWKLNFNLVEIQFLVVLDQHIWYQINPQDLSFQMKHSKRGYDAPRQVGKPKHKKLDVAYSTTGTVKSETESFSLPVDCLPSDFEACSLHITWNIAIINIVHTKYSTFSTAHYFLTTDVCSVPLDAAAAGLLFKMVGM